jgi:hypothetical protein
MKFLKRVPLHPFIMGMFPVISLFAHNQSQLEPGAPWRSLGIVLGGTAIVFCLLRWVIGDWTRSGFITTYASVLFFVYGPIKNAMLLYNIHLASINLGKGVYFLPLWIIVLALGIWLMVVKIPPGATSLLIINCIALSTLILPLTSVTSYTITHYNNNSATNQSNTVVAQDLTTLPDVYYIILDEYGRSDTIEAEFGYDNSAFLQSLRKQGFYVAGCSTSNYSFTRLSMASSLNMNYLDALGEGFISGNTDYSEVANLIQKNAVRQYLHQYGYDFVSFQNDFPFLNISNSDVYITVPGQKEYIQPFEMLLLQQTPGIYLLNEINKIAGTRQFVDSRAYGYQYDQTLFILDELTRLPTSDQNPKFVYAHLIIPHGPYVFGPNGEYVGDDHTLNSDSGQGPINQEAYKLGYTNQVQYIDSRIPKIVQEIISRSKTPPVIIIQGDHGFMEEGGAQRRMPILNAYYLPGIDSSKLLYLSITPVNTFRVVLNTYFKGQFELLPDLNYYSPDQHNMYDVIFIDNQSIGCHPK